MIDKIVLFGAGQRAKSLLELTAGSGIRIAAVFDSNTKKRSVLCDQAVLPIDDAGKYRHVPWCITIINNADYDAVRKTLLSLGYSPLDEIQYSELLRTSCDQSEIDGIIKCHNEDISEQHRILFDCTNGLILGGVEARTIILCEELVKKKSDLYIVSDSQGPKVDVSDKLRERIINTIIHTNGISAKQVLKNCLTVILEMLPCIVVTNQLDMLLLAAYLIKERYPSRIRIISNISLYTKTIIDNYMSYGTLSDYYIGVSKTISKDLIERGITCSKVRTLYSPFRCKARLARKYTIGRDPIIIGYAGRLDGMQGSQKRMDLVLQLIGWLSDNQIDFHFNIAGDGPAREQMEQHIRKKGFQDRVTFWGVVSKARISDFWEKQDIGINLADYEGRSVSVVEAMGAGAVPVVTDTSGVRDDIEHEKNGFIVPIGDYKMAADIIVYLSNNKELLPVMGKRAHEAVFGKSSIEKYVNEWEMILDYCARDLEKKRQC